ncbi:NAD(P)H-binding protein [Amycolatopsis aidingensis]|uniref:NAD(P)H-binding protein n=1 Tax=Amycolatopsis aidingensis TaxID=2842453 RepID=UPI001C0B9722|nr:NAD(P)H-binding protein [Amycolatopsis aidingensis]
MTILVTGATGNIGRMVVDRLAGAGEPVRALTRNPAKAALPEWVEVHTGFLGQPQTLPAALEGVDTVYLAPHFPTVQRFAELARAAGVRRVVTLSSILAGVPGAAESDPAGRDFAHLERTIEQAGFAWTHLRPGAFMENSLLWSYSIRAEGVVREPHAQAARTPIAMADIAEVAGVVLREEGHAGRAYPLSGPAAVTSPEQVRAIAAALGREIRFEELTPAQARELWVGQGMPPEAADWLLSDGGDYAEVPVSTVADLTGKPARTFAEWARENADLFR